MMRAFHQKVNPIVASVMISIAIVLLCHFLFGSSCGYVKVKSSITDMNIIFDNWQELRQSTIPAFSLNGAVPYETLAMMDDWRTLAYQLQVPSCLRDARSTLIDGIESDFQTFKLAQDRIPVDQKLEFLSSNESVFVRYQQNVELIETCAPTCNVDTGLHNLFEMLP